MNQAAWGAGEATRALLAFPLTSTSIMSADVLRNWILDSWAGKDRDNRITALPVTSTHTRHTETHSRQVSSERSQLRAAAEPSSPRLTPLGTCEWPPPEQRPLQSPCGAHGSSQQHTPHLPAPKKQLQHIMEGDWGVPEFSLTTYVNSALQAWSESNPCLLHWQADSLLRSHWEAPEGSGSNTKSIIWGRVVLGESAPVLGTSRKSSHVRQQVPYLRQKSKKY